MHGKLKFLTMNNHHASFLSLGTPPVPTIAACTLAFYLLCRFYV